MFLVFQRTAGNFFCVFIIRRINNHKLVCVVWTFTTCWLLAFSSNHGRWSASLMTHTWLIGSGVVPCPCHFVIIERLEEGDGLSFHYSAYYYTVCWFLLATIVGRWPASRTSFPRNPENVWGCYISSSHFLSWFLSLSLSFSLSFYIYIYIFRIIHTHLNKMYNLNSS